MERGAVGQGRGGGHVGGVGGQVLDDGRPAAQLRLQRGGGGAGGARVPLGHHLAHGLLVQRQPAEGHDDHQDHQGEDCEQEELGGQAAQGGSHKKIVRG